jgi:hypothetical protein
MSDAADKLKTTLGDLHAELRSLEQLDPETRRLLEEAAADIGRLVGGSQESGRAESHASIIDRLTNAARDFEESHPTLAGTVGSVIDALGRIGI